MHRTISRQQKLPVALKVLLLAFSITLAFHNATVYGPLSLLYICDVALFVATIGVCLELPMAVSFAAVSVIGIQLLWCIDLLLTAAGVPSAGLTGYMLIDDLPWSKRVLSMFHGWLPIVLLHALSRLGYRRAAFPMWLVACSVLLVICYAVVPPPPAPVDDPYLAVNVNYVFGLDAMAPQEFMPPELWIVTLMSGLALLIFLPTHLLLARCFPARLSADERQAEGVVLASEAAVRDE